MVEAIPLQVLDNFLLQYNVGQVLALAFVGPGSAFLRGSISLLLLIVGGVSLAVAMTYDLQTNEELGASNVQLTALNESLREEIRQSSQTVRDLESKVEELEDEIEEDLKEIEAELDRLEEEKRVILSASSPDRTRLAEINQRIPDLQSEMDRLAEDYVEEIMVVGGVDAGASAVQELGLTLALASEALHALTEAGLDPDAAAQQVTVSIDEAGLRHTVRTDGDVAREEDVARAVDRVASWCDGRLSLLVNNAGPSDPVGGPIEALSLLIVANSQSAFFALGRPDLWTWVLATRALVVIPALIIAIDAYGAVGAAPGECSCRRRGPAGRVVLREAEGSYPRSADRRSDVAERCCCTRHGGRCAGHPSGMAGRGRRTRCAHRRIGYPDRRGHR